jgi:hypothetical protein
MVEAGVDTYLLVSDRDPGISYVDAHFPDEMRQLRDLPGFRRVDISGSDHTFTPVSAQIQVSDLVTRHLTDRYLPAPRRALP